MALTFRQQRGRGTRREGSSAWRGPETGYSASLPAVGPQWPAAQPEDLSAAGGGKRRADPAAGLFSNITLKHGRQRTYQRSKFYKDNPLCGNYEDRSERCMKLATLSFKWDPQNGRDTLFSVHMKRGGIQALETGGRGGQLLSGSRGIECQGTPFGG